MLTDESPALRGSAFVVETTQQRKDRLQDEVTLALDEAKQRHQRIAEVHQENREALSFNEDARVEPEVFRSSAQFMSRAVRRYIHREAIKSELNYVGCSERMPFNFPSNDAAEVHLRHVKTRALAKRNASKSASQKAEHLSVPEAIEAFITSRLGATVMTFEGFDASTLIFYDYDARLYTFSQTLAARWLTVLTGSAPSNNVKTFVATLEGMSGRLAIYNPLPRWKIAVGNGVYNTLTRRLERYSPSQVVTSRIETDYRANPAEPGFTNGITFEKLVYDLADGNPDRVELIMQMCKVIITGYSATPAIFIMMGSGGDGKSLFMQLISGIIGAQNTGAMNFTDMGDENKVSTVVQKRAVIGFDNNERVPVRNTALLKSAASREVISLSRKYLTSVAMRFTGTVIQLCNSLPRFNETGPSIRRRMMMILCENSHYENGDEKYGLQENIKNKHWREYILWYILNEATNPYYTDFNDCDRAVINNSLDAEDAIGSFYSELDSSTDALNQEVLPRKLLYTAYLDWMASNHPNSKVHSSRSFASASNNILRAYGFEPGTDSTPTRMSTLEKITGTSFTSVFGYLANGPKVREMADDPQDVTRVLRRTGKRKNAHRNGRRFPKVCSAVEYFKIWDEIISDIEHHPAAYRDIFEECGLEYKPEPVFDTDPNNVDDPEDVLWIMDDENMGKRFENEYRDYMSSQRIASTDASESSEDETEDQPMRLADRIAQSVKSHEADFSKKLAPGQDVLVPPSFDPATATVTEFEEASDAELLEHLPEVQKRASTDDQIASRMMSVRVDLSTAVSRGDAEQVERVLDWMERCSEVADARDLRIGFASLVDRLIGQVISAAQTNKYSTLHTKMTSIADDEIDVRVDEVKEAARKMVGSISQHKDED